MPTPNLLGRHDLGTTVIAKAMHQISTITPNASLVPAQSMHLLELMQQAGILTQPGMCQFVPLKAPTQQINQVSLAVNGLHPVGEYDTLLDGQRTVPTYDKVDFSASKYMFEVLATEESLEDSIEQGQLENFILGLVAARLMPWLEDLAINSDTDSSYSQYAGLDGWLVQASAHIHDAAGDPMSPDLLEDTILRLPKPYRSKRSELSFMTSPEADRRYKRGVANRMTMAGDRYLEGDTEALYTGYPVVPVDYWPDDLGDDDDQTSLLLTDPSNLQIGVWRNFKIKTQEQIREDALLIVGTTRFDAKIAVDDATSLTTGISQAE